MSKALVEDLGDGAWLIKPTGEILKCSRSTAYRKAKAAANQIKPKTEDTQKIEEIEVEEVQELRDDTPLEEDTLEINSDSFDELTIETPVFNLPTLEDLNGGGAGENPETFQGESESFDQRDDDFINSIKGAEIVEDDEGNKKIHIKDILVGDNPLIHSMFRGLDSSLYAWAENKHGLTLWNEDSRAAQRAIFIKTLSLIAPKTSIQLDPHWVIVGLGFWLYGVPLLKIARVSTKGKKSKKQLKKESFSDQTVPKVIFDE
jgi:hypothetical protein